MLRDELGAAVTPRLCALGGPSFAREVALGHADRGLRRQRERSTAARCRTLLASDRFRVYSTDDVIGVELGGALKNVIAIAAGVADGLGFGHNARAGLITRGIAEMTPARDATGRAPADARGPERHGRPGADLHRRSLAQPHGRASSSASGTQPARSARPR